MRNRGWTVVALFSFIIPLGLVLFLNREQIAPPVNGPANGVAEARAQAARTAPLKTSADEMRQFEQTVFWPALKHIAKTYPSLRLRKQFADMLTDWAESGKAIRFLPRNASWAAQSFGIETPTGVQFMIGYSAPFVMRVFETDGEQAMHHLLLAYTLHEGYHLEHHPDRDWPPLRQRESEAWAHDCGNTIRILREDNLFEELPPQSFYRFVARACDKAGGNREHPSWQALIDVATGARPLSSLPYLP